MQRKLRRALFYLAASGLSFFGLSPASASVLYEFNGTTDFGQAVNFTLTADDFVDTFAKVPQASLDSCKWQLVSTMFLDCYAVVFDAGFDPNFARLIVMFTQPTQLGNFTGASYLFEPGSLTTLGTFQSIGGPTATLKVTDPSAVPEPSTWAMILLGFAAIGFTARRRWKGPLTQLA